MDLQTVYFDHYRPAKAATRRESTVVGYDSAIRLHILPAIGERDITEISPKDVQAMVDAIERPGAALKALKPLRQASAGGRGANSCTCRTPPSSSSSAPWSRTRRKRSTRQRRAGCFGDYSGTSSRRSPYAP